MSLSRRRWLLSQRRGASRKDNSNAVVVSCYSALANAVCIGHATVWLPNARVLTGTRLDWNVSDQSHLHITEDRMFVWWHTHVHTHVHTHIHTHAHTQCVCSWLFCIPACASDNGTLHHFHCSHTAGAFCPFSLQGVLIVFNCCVMTTFNHLDLWLEELKEVRLVHRHIYVWSIVVCISYHW